MIKYIIKNLYKIFYKPNKLFKFSEETELVIVDFEFNFPKNIKIIKIIISIIPIEKYNWINAIIPGRTPYFIFTNND